MRAVPSVKRWPMPWMSRTVRLDRLAAGARLAVAVAVTAAGAASGALAGELVMLRQPATFSVNAGKKKSALCTNRRLTAGDCRSGVSRCTVHCWTI
jgi:hypothetical protein